CARGFHRDHHWPVPSQISQLVNQHGNLLRHLGAPRSLEIAALPSRHGQRFRFGDVDSDDGGQRRLIRYQRFNENLLDINRSIRFSFHRGRPFIRGVDGLKSINLTTLEASPVLFDYSQLRAQDSDQWRTEAPPTAAAQPYRMARLRS